MLRDMCRDCNSHLGARIDAPLVDHVLTQIRRARFGLRGKKGAIPNPFSRGTLADHPERHVLVDLSTGMAGAEPHKSEEPTETGGVNVRMVVDKADEARVPSMMAKIRERAARDGRTVAPFTMSVEHHDQPTVRFDLEIDMTRWIGGIMKICYELACLEFGESYLSDPWAVRFRSLLTRQTITHDDVVEAGFFGDAHGPGRTPVQAQDVFADSQLIGVLRIGAGRIGACVRILNLVEGSFAVSENISDFALSPEGIAHLIDVETGIHNRFTDGSGWPL